MVVLVANQNESIATLNTLRVEHTFRGPTIFQKGTPVWSKSNDGAGLFVMPDGNSTTVVYLNGVLAEDVRYEKDQKIDNVAVVTAGVVSVHTEIVGYPGKSLKNLGIEKYGSHQWKPWAILGDKILKEFRLVLKPVVRTVPIKIFAPQVTLNEATFRAELADFVTVTVANLKASPPSGIGQYLADELTDFKTRATTVQGTEVPNALAIALPKIDILLDQALAKYPALFDLFAYDSDMKTDYLDIYNGGGTDVPKIKGVDSGQTEAQVAADDMFMRPPNEDDSGTGLDEADSKTDYATRIAVAEAAVTGITAALQAYYEEIFDMKWGALVGAGYKHDFSSAAGFAGKHVDFGVVKPPMSNPSVKKSRALKASNPKTGGSRKTKTKPTGPLVSLD